MDISRLSDEELWVRTKTLASSERASVCDLVEHLAEIDKRGLHARRMHASMFEYCIHFLHLSEEAAYRRIRAARAIQKFPPISGLLREGKLTIETVALIHPFLNDEGAAPLVTKCIGLRKWEVQRLIAGRQPDAPQRDFIRVLAAARTVEAVPAREDEPLLSFTMGSIPSSGSEHPASPPPQVSSQAPPSDSPEHAIRVAFTADAEFHRFLLRARQLLRHKYPDGRLEGVLKDALVALLERRDLGFRWGAGVRRV